MAFIRHFARGSNLKAKLAMVVKNSIPCVSSGCCFSSAVAEENCRNMPLCWELNDEVSSLASSMKINSEKTSASLIKMQSEHQSDMVKLQCNIKLVVQEESLKLQNTVKEDLKALNNYFKKDLKNLQSNVNTLGDKVSKVEHKMTFFNGSFWTISGLCASGLAVVGLYFAASGREGKMEKQDHVAAPVAKSLVFQSPNEMEKQGNRPLDHVAALVAKSPVS
ncbi:hypothetical protein GOP47_0029889 [Adiantum capillus-veneris]|nr:hypothetical protein GOP47_0029889 [Adiantum capillus-veneris]